MTTKTVQRYISILRTTWNLLHWNFEPPARVRRTLDHCSNNEEQRQQSTQLNLLRWNDVPRTSRTFRPKIPIIFLVLSVFKYNKYYIIKINLLLLSNFYPAISLQYIIRIICSIRVWSLVMVRNQLPAQVVNSARLFSSSIEASHLSLFLSSVQVNPRRLPHNNTHLVKPLGLYRRWHGTLRLAWNCPKA